MNSKYQNELNEKIKIRKVLNEWNYKNWGKLVYSYVVEISGLFYGEFNSIRNAARLAKELGSTEFESLLK